jgi:hypothetical protein
MKMKKGLLIIALAAAVLMFSCEEEGNGDLDVGVDFTSHNTNYSILVRNNTSERLIAFKGDLRHDMLIGGIPSRAQNHGLPNDLSLFDKTESFPMILITESQYEANRGELNSLRNTPFTRVFVFFNRSGDNTTVYEIAEGLGGRNEFRIVNASNSINIELRVGGVAGVTLGFAPAGMMTTILRLADGDYDIFPVFVRYNAFRDVVETVYPQGAASGYAWYRSFSFDGGPSVTMNLRDLLSGVSFSSGAAWVVVNNQTQGGVQFLAGTQTYVTPSGVRNIMSSPVTFQIDMPRVGGVYDDSVVVANWRFGPTGHNVPLQVSESNNTVVSSVTLERDKMYTVTVTGDHNDNTLKAWISSIADIPASELGGTW